MIRLYEPAPLGTNALKRLGEAIGRRDRLDERQQALYEQFIRDARERVLGTQTFVNAEIQTSHAALARLGGVEATGRWKTLSTLADKLERTPAEKLPSIHDVAGIRVVAEFTLMEQDIFVDRLRGQFAKRVEMSREPLLIDRRESPSHGYRAVHLIVWPSGRPVEIQVRTQLQHAWAQVVELLGDRWGRGLRYGEPIEHPDPEVRAQREARVAILMEASQLIATFEASARSQGVLHLTISDEVFRQTGTDPAIVEQWKETARRNVADLKHVEDQVRQVMTMLRAPSIENVRGTEDNDAPEVKP